MRGTHHKTRSEKGSKFEYTIQTVIIADPITTGLVVNIFNTDRMTDIYYFHLSSEDSKNFHPSNTPLDFTVELPAPLYLEGEWEVALLDIDFDDWLSDLYVFCDMCKHSVYEGILQPVLRRVPKFGLDTMPQYVPVQVTYSCYLKKIHVYIKESTLTDGSYLTKPTTCTLQLRKRQP